MQDLQQIPRTALVGTAGQVEITGDATRVLAGGSPITLSLPSSLSLTGLTLSGLTASRLVATDGSKALSSVAALTSWIAGTSNRITVGDDGDGSVTLNLPQDIHTAAVPDFAGAVLTNAAQRQLRLAYDGSLYVDFRVFNTGSMQITPSHAGLDHLAVIYNKDATATLALIQQNAGASAALSLTLSSSGSGSTLISLNRGSTTYGLKVDAADSDAFKLTLIGTLMRVDANGTALFGYTRGGTATDALGVGDAVFGLAGTEYRLFWDQSDGNLRFFRASTGTAHMVLGPEASDNSYWGFGAAAGISTLTTANYFLECSVTGADPGLFFNVPLTSGYMIFTVENANILLRMDETVFHVNPSNGDIDFQVRSLNETMLIVDAATDKVYIGGTDAWRFSDGAGLEAQGNRRFSHGTSALLTTATEGFLHIQSCAGTPTGVPDTIPTGQIPLVWDSTNNILYAYDGGWVNTGAGGAIGGSGTNTQLAYFTAGTTLASDAGLTYDAANDLLTVAGRLRVGTATDDASAGDAVFGLTGSAYRLLWDQSDGDLRFFRSTTGTAYMSIGPLLESNEYWGIGVAAGITTHANANSIIAMSMNVADPGLYLNAPIENGFIDFFIENTVGTCHMDETEVVVNPYDAGVDFRVRGDSVTQLLHVDVSADAAYCGNNFGVGTGADFAGGTNILSIKEGTEPTSDPAAGTAALYVKNGSLKCRIGGSVYTLTPS